MKLIHLSDLHLGKRLGEYSLLEDQRHILFQILGIVEVEAPDVVLIAGDVYDKSVPSAEAVSLFDDFLVQLSMRKVKTFVISGNHDSAERIAFGARLMEKSGVYLAPVYDGTLTPIEFSDAFGKVQILLLPFLKPAHVKRFDPDGTIESYTDAVRAALSHAALDENARHVLVAHQFVTGAARCDSEDVLVGGLDNVDAGVFSAFDYVALGHLHTPQCVQRPTVRYCGTPLKYSVSEAADEKSVTVVELREKGAVSVRTISLCPLHELRVLRGAYETLVLRGSYEGTRTDDYLRVMLTDEEPILDASARLRSIYPNIVSLDYDNARTRRRAEVDTADAVEQKTPLMLFSELYEKQNNAHLDETRRAYVTRLIDEIEEEEP